MKSSSSKYSQKEKASGKYVKEICKFYPNCYRGDSCRFTHPSTEPEPSQEVGHCLICLETKIEVYGLLLCDHIHCFSCISEWRSSAKAESSKETLQKVRGCTVCAKESLYVVPSKVFLTGTEKNEFIGGYINSKKNIPCKRFNYGDGYCPFKHSCFYSHVDHAGVDKKIQQREAWNKATNGKDITPGSVEAMMLSRNRQRPIRIGRRNIYDQFTSNELEMMMDAIRMIRINGIEAIVASELYQSDASDDYLDWFDSEYSYEYEETDDDDYSDEDDYDYSDESDDYYDSDVEIVN